MRLPDRMRAFHAATRGVLLWEMAWRALLPLICVLGLFLALALLALPALLPPWVHAAYLALFALLLLGALWFAVGHWRLPDHHRVLRRLETDSALSHRPLGALEDRLTNAHDALAAALWRTHQRRAQAHLRRLRLGPPRPGLPKADPWAARALVFLLLAAGLLVGGLEAEERLGRALVPDFSAKAGAAAELEAWLNPPDYTGLPPLKLDPKKGETLRVAQGSTIMARVFGGGAVPRMLIDGVAAPFKRIDGRNYELTRTIEAGRRLGVVSGERMLAEWPLEIVSDQPPVIDSDQDPRVTARQALRLSYKATDDYGLAKVWAEIRLPKIKKRSAAAGTGGPETAPKEDVLSLDLPVSPPGAKDAREAGYFDLTPHPWAGRLVMLHYLARDDRGQVGKAEVIILRLPKRQFHHPVARAIIEQRADLSLHPGRRFMVALALFAITSGPETFDHDQATYLMLWTTARRLQINRKEPAAAVLDILWRIALRIEDGGMSLAERELRDAQKALMAALAEGADQDEIDRLMDRLQQAMDKYLQALMEQAQQNTQAQNSRPLDPNARTMDAEELQKMLDRIRELSRLGSKDAAREMLRKLQEMLENLESKRMTAEKRGGSPSEKAMRKLGDLLQKQQELMDKTYQQTPRRRRMPWEKRKGGDGEQGEGERAGERRGRMDGGRRRAMGELAGRQGALRGQLGEVMRRLSEGMGRIPGAMGGVDQSMRESQQALRSGRGGPALSSQRQAIDGLASSFRELAEEMMRQAQDDGQGDFGLAQEDPAGRPFQGGGMDTSRVMVPTDSDMQRARHILDELRRRAGERARPRQERNYID
ncbi:MAG: TIGR02302 family protein, partial [Alphaproteobacteria bacterium]